MIWMVGLNQTGPVFRRGTSVQAIHVREEDEEVSIDRYGNLSRELVVVWDTQCLLVLCVCVCVCVCECVCEWCVCVCV